MAANATHLILHQKFNLYIKPTSFFHFSKTPFLQNFSKPLYPLHFSFYKYTILQKPRYHCSISSSSVQSVNESVEGGRSGSLSQSPVFESREKIDVNPPKGTRDFAPEDMRLRSWLFQNFRELYCFEDRGNRRVALRPELTPSLARMVIQKGKSVPLPLKWFAIGQCWRYERMTRGRRREHYQWNMDIIGVPEVTAEAELISSIVTFFKRLGITSSDVGFRVSSRKVLQEVLRCYSVPENLFSKVCIIIDKMEKIPRDDIKRDLKTAGISEEAIEELLQVLSIKSLSKLEGL
ncbi:hypothetical protein IFM89_028936 [Coptis chinensis]|uniref:histidine--tRNA ligase n=1 Tax=Coptis chinensis TaxID=261450 RepID=A0A835LJV6_9MAGN|nr:hypothetical protein IFM89_028936 [Coptis chinensis]